MVRLRTALLISSFVLSVVLGMATLMLGHVIYSVSGIPTFGVPYEKNGRYYVRSRGEPKHENPWDEISRRQYTTYIGYRRIMSMLCVLSILAILPPVVYMAYLRGRGKDPLLRWLGATASKEDK